MTDQQSNRDVAVHTGSAISVWRADLERLKPQFQYALPSHIPVERFIRVVMTALQNNPKLLRCTKQSLFNAAMRCAQDGLLPDGREAALVPFGDDPESGRSKPDQAQYMPMVRGIRKLVRNSGLLSDWNVQIVQEGDDFDYQLGDKPFIHHRPSKTGGRTRKVIFAYSIATYPDGTLSREVMNADQIKDIQSKSRAKRGPWQDPIFFPEMCRKTVARLHSKQLPMSTDLDTVMRRDEDLYDFAGDRARRDKEETAKTRPPSISAALDSFADEMSDDDDAHETTERQEPQPQSTSASTPEEAADPAAREVVASGGTDTGVEKTPTTPEKTAAELEEAAYARGASDRVRGMQRKAVPTEWRAAEFSRLAIAWTNGWDSQK
jgi:recombination protein RecT